MPSSNIIKTDAITLRIAPFSNTSHIVTWLTQNHGKIATVIKGACRPKSPVFGQYDIGFLCELLFYARDHNGLHMVKECATIDSRPICRGNWKITAAISYLCHLAGIATPDGAHAPELYKLLESTLNKITANSISQAPTLFLPSLWFELKLLNILGLPPQLNRCTSCDAPIATSHNMLFSAIEGGIICNTCHSAGRSNNTLQCTGDALAILRRIQSASDYQTLQTIRYSKIQQNQINQLLGTFLTFHLDLSPSCRSIAYRMFETTIN